MDVGRVEHRPELVRRQLLFGVVSYAAGRLGEEPVRSQGHVHRVAVAQRLVRRPSCTRSGAAAPSSTCRSAPRSDPGRCFAIEAGPGEVVVVPPGWAHATVSADPDEPMTFGAWCDREYGFEYDAVRARGGLAWFALLDEGGRIVWRRNERYLGAAARRAARAGVPGARPARRRADLPHVRARPEAVQWVSQPARAAALWPGFEP